MAEKCVRCGVGEDRIKLFDAIYEGRANCICERCSIIENVDIIERPGIDKIKESDRIDVYERMKRLAGIQDTKKSAPEERKNRLEELRKNPNLETPQKKTPELIDHFHWEIMKCRRRKGLSHNQLGEAIGEPGFSIEMIEKGNLGENAEVLIKKLEQFFNIRLMKVSPLDLMKKAEQKMPVLLDEDGNVLETIPEPAMKLKEEDLFLEELFEDEEEEKTENKKFFSNFLNKFRKSNGKSESDENDENEGPLISNETSDNTDLLSDEYDSEEREVGSDFFKSEDCRTSGEENGEIKDLDLDSIDKDKVKIGDLKEWHRRRVESTREERVEEQKRIQERAKLIEARREELRSIKEKDSKDIDNLLGGAELLKKEVLNGFEKSN